MCHPDNYKNMMKDFLISLWVTNQIHWDFYSTQLKSDISSIIMEYSEHFKTSFMLKQSHIKCFVMYNRCVHDEAHCIYASDFSTSLQVKQYPWIADIEVQKSYHHWKISVVTSQSFFKKIFIRYWTTDSIIIYCSTFVWVLWLAFLTTMFCWFWFWLIVSSLHSSDDNVIREPRIKFKSVPPLDC